MAERRPTQRYLSGRVKIAGTEALSTDRHLYVSPNEVEPNLGYVGEKPVPLASQYYQLVTIENGGTYDRYWQAQTGLIPGGITIFDEGFQVGTANSVTKLNFVGAAVTATVSGSISTISVAPSSRVAVGTEPPGGSAQGDLWWDSDIGELYVYYEDGDSNQWVETAGGSETVTISDNPPPSPNSGDLWWESDTARLKVYYDDGDSQQWVDASAGLLDDINAQFTVVDNGLYSLSNIGIGTTDPLAPVEATNTTVLAAGIVTANYFYGDGSNLTGIGAGTTWAVDDVGIHTTKNVGIGTTAKDEYQLYVEGDARITGILTVGPASITLDGIENNLFVGTGVTIYGTAGIVSAFTYYGDGSNLTGINAEAISGDINTTGVITATAFYGDGSNLTGVGGTVTISDNPPSNAEHGDLWWESDTGDLKVYYDENEVGAGTSAFWVSASGGDDAVAISTDAPSPATSGDLWFNSESGNLLLYYDDGDSAQWLSLIHI